MKLYSDKIIKKKFEKFNSIYLSEKLLGSGKIYKKYLGIPESFKLPLTIPHGIDFFTGLNRIDYHSYEPIYICFNEKIFKNIKNKKYSLRFPHPWLILTINKKIKTGKGTIFISSASSSFHDNQLLKKIKTGNFEKPFSILLKNRNNLIETKKWWLSKNIKPFCAGSMTNKYFYENLFNILNPQKHIAVISMTSAAVFAASIGKKIICISNFVTKIVDSQEIFYHKPGSKAFLYTRNTWQKLLSSNKNISKKTALNLLGIEFLKTKKELNNELYNSLNNCNKLFHINTHNILIYNILKICMYLKLPIIKYYKNFFLRLKNKILKLIKFKTVCVVEIDDFAYFRLKGKFKKIKKKYYNLKHLKYVEWGQPFELKQK